MQDGSDGQTIDKSTVYPNDTTLVSRSTITITSGDIPCLNVNVQPQASLNSPAWGKRFSPHDDDENEDSNENGFRMVSNRKKKTSIYVTSPNVMLSNNVSSIAGMTGAVQQHAGNSTTPTTSPMVITDAAARFALTRYPFPPFTIRFDCLNVNIEQVQRELVEHVAKVHKKEMNVISCRRSNVRCNTNETDVLIYLKEAEAFVVLMSKSNWPLTIASRSFIFPNTPSLPPQLSLLVKNVDLRTNLVEFEHKLKQLYPEVKNVIRMKNKVGNDINLVKLECTSLVINNKLLNDKKLKLNHIAYEVTEFLAPINVLICSKCCGIGKGETAYLKYKSTSKYKSSSKSLEVAQSTLKLH